MLRCPDVELLLAPFAADELDREAAEAVAEHLVRCDACRCELVAEMALRRDLASLPTQACPAGVGRAPWLVSDAATRTVPAPVTSRRRWHAVAAGLGLAAALAAAAVLPGRLGRTPQDDFTVPNEIQFSAEEVAAAHRDMVYTLTLTARILDRTGRQTMTDVFSDRLPTAVSGFLRRPVGHTQGG